jgi:hypothetical protein
MRQRFDSRFQLDERAEFAHGCDAPGQHGASHDRPPDLGGAQPLRIPHPL